MIFLLKLLAFLTTFICGIDFYELEISRFDNNI